MENMFSFRFFFNGKYKNIKLKRAFMLAKSNFLTPIILLEKSQRKLQSKSHARPFNG